MKIADHYRLAIRQLGAALVPDPEIEAAILLGSLLGLNRAQLMLAADEELADVDAERFRGLLERRLCREPLAYILGEQEFWSLPFLVTPDVLIPRPETEEVVAHALKLMTAVRPSPQAPMVLDLGCGSGVIAVVLALEIEAAAVYAVDRSPAAIRVAKENARRHRLSERIRFACADWLSAIRDQPFFDLVVCNPPYVARSAAPSLQPEVRLFEPELALYGGDRGDETIRSLLGAVHRVLRPGGWLVMEIGADQEDALCGLLATMKQYERFAVDADYAGLPRILTARAGDRH